MNLQIIPERAYYKTRNAGTRNNKTRNTGGTVEHHRTVGKWEWEHPGTPMEQQRNTSGTPRNNETIQNEEKL